MRRVKPMGNPSVTEVENAAVPQPVAPEGPPAEFVPPVPEVAALDEHGPKVRMVQALCGVITALGVATMFVTWLVTENHFTNVWLAIVFAIGIGFLQVMPVRLSHEGQGEVLHLEEAFLVAAALFLSPFE